MLALLVLDELKMLQSGDDVVCLDGRHVAQAFDADAAFMIPQHLQSSCPALTMARMIRRPKSIWVWPALHAGHSLNLT